MDKRVVKNEAAIIEAGIDVFCSNPEAGMTDVARAAGISRATLYRHFPTRELLVKKLALTCVEEMEAAYEPYETLRGADAFEAMFDVFIPMAKRFRFLLSLWSIAEHDRDIIKINDEMRNGLFHLIDQAKEAGVLNAQMPTEWIAHFFDHTLLAAWEFTADDQPSAKAATEFANQSFFGGCGAN